MPNFASLEGGVQTVARTDQADKAGRMVKPLRVTFMPNLVTLALKEGVHPDSC